MSAFDTRETEYGGGTSVTAPIAVSMQIWV